MQVTPNTLRPPEPQARPLDGGTFLVTGITTATSLALHVAREIQAAGGETVCTGLGPTAHHGGLGERATAYLERTYRDFRDTVREALGEETRTYALDVGLDESAVRTAAALRSAGVRLDGVLHSIAMDRTIRGGAVKPLLSVTREEFADTMSVSAYSLIALCRALLEQEVLARGASVVALSYIGAERVARHPYKNIGVAKAALERIAIELAHELGPSHGIRVNAVRFSPYTASRAGGAIAGLAEAEEHCAQASPLGNATPRDLAREVVHLLQPGLRVTAEIRHVDGGYHALA